MSFLPMILIFVAFWFLLIAPQRKKQKEHDKMIKALEKGANVKTVGGIFGTVTGVKDDFVFLGVLACCLIITLTRFSSTFWFLLASVTLKFTKSTDCPLVGFNKVKFHKHAKKPQTSIIDSVKLILRFW